MVHNLHRVDALIRSSIATAILVYSIQFNYLILLPLSALLFYTAYQQNCFLYKLLHINRQCSLNNYYVSLLPQYNPSATFILNKNGKVIYKNNEAMSLFQNVQSINDIYQGDYTTLIENSSDESIIYNDKERSYKILLRGIKEQKYLLAYVNDITDEINLIKQNNEQTIMLMQQSKHAQMGEMIGMIAHQWKQPLSGISTISSSLRIQIDLENITPTYMQTQLTKIDNFIAHMSHTIDDFRNFFQTDKSLHNVQVADVIDSAVELLLPSLQNNNITIHQNYHNVNPLNTYPNELKQVMIDLIKNAQDILVSRAISQPYIDIKILEKNNSFYIEVQDNAKGIDEDIINKIFDQNFTTKGDNGTGLGLYMSKMIIEDSLKGELLVENNKDGALFVIKLKDLITNN